MSNLSCLKELESVRDLLKVEYAEDLRIFKQKMLGTSRKERRAQGVLWYPVDLEVLTYAGGEQIIAKVSRPKEHHEQHSFQNGKLVSFFSGDETEEQSVTGVVNTIRGESMTITLNCDEKPSWVEQGYLGVQLLFDENAYKEMFRALDRLLEDPNERQKYLMQVLLGEKEAFFGKENTFVNPYLNEQQNKAFLSVLNAKDVAIIHGPPGTGKTTTLIQSILHELKNTTQVLVCAPSNAAVDLLVDKLAQQGVQSVRIGHPARVTEEALSYTLDAQCAQHDQYKLVRELRKRSEEFFKMGGKWKRNFGNSEREQRKLMLAEARKLRSEAEGLQDFITSDVIGKCRVVATTLVGAANNRLKGMNFDVVFIDEAAQALEPAAWIPVLKAKKVVLAGDHHQLPPTIKSYEAAQNGLEETLFEKAIKRTGIGVLLEEQYRMHEQIMQFSSDQFYSGRLKAHASVKDSLLLPGELVVEFIDTAGCGFDETIHRDSRSSYNPEEANLVLKHLKDLVGRLHDPETKIAVISPYKAQVQLLKERVQEDELLAPWKNQISVNSIDSFQGQEREVVYISLVRSNEKGVIGFLKEVRRLNVALTRAKKKLVVIGDSATITRHPFYNAFFEYTQEIGAYKSAFELLYD